MPAITATPIMNNMPLMINLEAVAWMVEASAKMTAKKNKTATAIPPIIVMTFTRFRCIV